MITRRPGWAFGRDEARQALQRHFGTATLEGFGFGEGDDGLQAIRAAGAIIEYLAETQRTGLEHIDRLVPYSQAGTLEIDQSSRRSLEISRTIRQRRREGSLLWVLDRTVTAMGSRLMADWVANPLIDVKPIRHRHEAVDEMLADATACEALRERLRQVYDLERLLGRVATGRATPRDLSFVGRTLRGLPELKARLSGRRSARLGELEQAIDLCGDLADRLERALVDDCPLNSREGGFIREGFHEPLDQLRELAQGGKQWIAEYQASESRRTDIPNLKVGYNRVFGYYIEVTHAHRDKIPDDYIRKQTLKNAERYITPELKEYEEKVLTADEKAKGLEYDLFIALRNQVAGERRRIAGTATALAEVDVLLALAELARGRNYCRPEMTDEPTMEIVDGRHPVLDVLQPEGTFVPNDVRFGDDGGTLLLITGPNMAGKSTYIRQVALMSIMAQMGSFVPARRATIGVADRVFARVGASDELTRGQSTFMVEMTETARILNTATPRSLVILDEIGRGTSTYDGISLAWAVAEHLHDRVGCRTLFATHYHELTDLHQELSGLRNLNVSVREWQDEVVFLHKIVEGAADKSFGLHVARLAGVPRGVVDRAKDILAQLESEHHDSTGRARIARGTTKRAGQMQLTLFAPLEHPLLDEIRGLDLDDTTPREAMQRVARWQAELQREAEQEQKR
jgi:DNA mismatch repair protein MutS